MKARLSAAMSDEDGEIFWSVQVHFRRRAGFHVIHSRSLIGHSTDQDRRDAEIMLAMREFGWKRFALGHVIFFCLPETLESWWYCNASGVFEQLV